MSENLSDEEEAALDEREDGMFTIKPIDEEVLSNATKALEKPFATTENSFSSIILTLTRTVNAQQEQIGAQQAQIDAQQVQHQAQIKSLKQSMRAQINDIKSEMQSEKHRSNQRVSRLEASLVDARNHINMLEYNLSGHEADDFELPPWDYTENLKISSAPPPASAGEETINNPDLDVDLCLYVGSFPVGISREDLQSELDGTDVVQIEVISAKLSSYALLYFGDIGEMEAARSKVLGLASKFEKLVCVDFPRTLRSNSGLLLANLRAAFPSSTSGDELEDALKLALAEYEVKHVSTNFGGATTVTGAAFVQFQDAKRAHEVLSDISSSKMSVDLSAASAKFLDFEEQEDLASFKKELQQKLDVSRGTVLVSGLSQSVTEDELRDHFPFATSMQVAKCRSGSSLGIAEVHFKEPVSDSNIADFSNLSIGASNLTVEALLASDESINIDAEAKEEADRPGQPKEPQLESFSNRKVKDPKMVVTNRIHDMEAVMDKWFGEDGGIFEKMQLDLMRAEQALDAQRTTMEAIKDISDPDFSDAFNERAGSMIEDATGAAAEDAVARAVRLVADSGIIEESSDGGWQLNEACIKAVMQPSIDTANKTLAKVGDDINRVEGVLPGKLDGPALRVLVKLLDDGADLDQLLNDLDTQRASGGNEEDPGYLFPFDYYSDLLEAGNPMQMITAPLQQRFASLDEVKANKKDVSAAIAGLEQDKQDKAAALAIKKQTEDELANLGQRCTKFGDTVDAMDGVVKALDRRVNRELGEIIPERFADGEQAVEKLRQLLEEQTQRGGTLDEELKSMTGKLSERPTESQVRSMLNDLEASLKSRSNNSNNDKVEAVVESLRQELNTKMSRDDVSQLITMRLKDAEDALNADDSSADNMWTLKAGSIPDTIAIGKVKYKVFRGGLHNYPTSTATHKRISPISATQAMPTPLQQQQLQQDSLMSMTSTNTLSIASHSSSGRGGALRSLMGRTPPLNPVHGNNASGSRPFSGERQRPSTTSAAMSANRSRGL